MDVRTDFKPEPTPKRAPKRLKRGNGFRRNPTLAAQFRFAVLREFGGRCILADYTGGTDAQSDTGHDPSGASRRDEATDPRDARTGHTGARELDGVGFESVRCGSRIPPRDGSQLPGLAHVCDGPLDPAHLIPKQTLRKLGFPETVVYDHRNGVAACRKAHRRNDDGLERFPYELLPPSVSDFCRDHNLTYLLDKLYGRSTG